MNTLLIHLNPLGYTFQIGLAYIASVLKKSGHNVAFLPLSGVQKGAILKKLKDNKTEIILISSTSDAWPLCNKVIDFINRNCKIPVLIGGLHPTFCPEESITRKGILGLCIGEGEYPAAELLDAITGRRDCAHIANLWIKKNGEIYKNGIRDLISDLDSLPPPDYKIFSEYINLEHLPVILSRGCLFNCSYCCNHAYHKLYKGRGKIVRRHSISYSIDLIKNLLKEFPMVKEIEFYDEVFTVDYDWLKGFLERFSEFGIRFICNSRFDVINEDLVKLLVGRGCKRINLAVECGSEKIRREVLKRPMSDHEIIEASRLVKSYGIGLHTHNMVGLPYERESDILKTAELNKNIGADSVQVSIFTPYPATDLYRVCREKGWIAHELNPSSYRDFTILKTPHIKPHLVNYYFLIFNSLVYKRGFLLLISKILFWLLHFRNNSLYIIFRDIKKNISSLIGIRFKSRIKGILHSIFKT